MKVKKRSLCVVVLMKLKQRNSIFGLVALWVTVWLTTLLFVRQALPQRLPPPIYDGFNFRPLRDLDSPFIAIEAFFDPLCPDARDSWPPLKQAVQHYGSRVNLRVHLLPLPYHDYAYAASQALHIVNSINSSFAFPVLEGFFEYQGNFYNYQTKEMSRVSVIDKMQNLVAGIVGNEYYSQIVSGFNDVNSDLKTRVSFKYSASRGVSGTPTFFVNGFALTESGTPVDFNGWRKLIDPLLGLGSAYVA